MSDVEQLLSAMALAPPPTHGAVKEALSELAVRPPSDYVEFIRTSNGGEGAVGLSYLQLWPIETLMSRTALYAVDEFAPGLVLFGSDGGGMAYAFVLTGGRTLLAEVPFVGMSHDAIKFRGESFCSFLEAIAAER
jgi:SMI1/KNR4 family protein SUKH-1